MVDDGGGREGRWACLGLPGDRSAGPVAREWVRRLVADEPVDVDAVELVVAELVANAVLHAAPPVELRLGWSAGALLVEVTDGLGDLAAVGRCPRTVAVEV